MTREPEPSREPSRDSIDPSTAREAQSPTALRIVLGHHLRRLRQARSITVEAASQAIQASHAKISRLELGRVGFRESDVAKLLTVYGLTAEEERAAFLALVRRSNVPGWWHQYSDIVPSWFETYLGLEQASSAIRTYQPQLIPGLLQIRQVARTIIQLGHPEESDDDIEHRVALRMARQEILTQPGAPLLWAVLEEQSLWRLNRPSLMRKQIEHLIMTAERPNINLQVIPIHSNAHVAVGGSFTILRFADANLPDIVYLEQLTSALYLDKHQDVEHYRMIMDQLSVQAQSPKETIEFLYKIIKTL
jgi:transcriptional regulator with XRE-family HTH domain